jgi:hypothetical protein
MALSLLVVVQSTIMLAGYFYTVSKSDPQVFLADDGYYEYSKHFYHTGEISRGVLGPGVPSILLPVFFFPEALHPFLRLMISLAFSIGVLILVSEISKKYLNPVELLLGGLVLVLNISWIHWVLKLTPEIFLAFCLGLYIWFLQRHLDTKKRWYILAANVPFIYAIFIKPVFILIPFCLLLYGWISRKPILAFSMINIAVCLISFALYTSITSLDANTADSRNADSLTGYNITVKAGFIIESFWFDYMIRTRQLHKGIKTPYREGRFADTVLKDSKVYINGYFEKHPGADYIALHVDFFRNYTWLSIQNLLLSPFIFFMLGTTSMETYILIPVTIISFVLSVLGLSDVFKHHGPDDRAKLTILLVVLIGFSLPYYIFHCYARYSMPLLPFIYIWSGIAIVRAGNSLGIPLSKS